MTIASNLRPYQKDLIITPAELKSIFLFGVDQTNDDGEPFPDEMYEFYILSAQSWLETQLGGVIFCEKMIEKESHDYYVNDYMQYSFVKLFRYPVQEVTEVSFQFPLSTNLLTFDPSWYRTESVGAHVHLIPTQGTFSSILLSQGGSFLPLFYAGTQHVPHLLKVSYKAGFKRDQIPYNLKEIVGMKAAMGPLNIAGDLIAGAGIATKSLSMDGLSQSISTTSSATNAGFGARILQYNKEIEERLKGLREWYVGISMVVA